MSQTTPIRRAATTTTGAFAIVGDSLEDRAGQILVANLYSLLKTAAMYAPGHPSTQDQARRFMSTIKPQFGTLSEQEMCLSVLGEHVYLNRMPVRIESAQAPRVAWLIDQLGRRSIHELTLRNSLIESDLMEFARRFSAAAQTDVAIDWSRPLTTISVSTQARRTELDELLEFLLPSRRFPALQLYAELLAFSTRQDHLATRNKSLELVQAKRLVGRVIDQLRFDAGALLGLTLLRPLAGTPANRRADTFVVATATAATLGLDDLALLELGTAYLTVPVDDSRPRWWSRRPALPTTAAALFGAAGDDLSRVLAFELAGGNGPRLADDYYGMAAPKHVATLLHNAVAAWVELLQPSDSTSPMSPELALQTVSLHVPDFFDDIVVRALMVTLGVFPPGSVVRLNSGDMAVVLSPPPVGADPRRPSVRPFVLGSVDTYDLFQPELESYRIVGMVDRSEWPQNPTFAFLQ